MKIMHATFALLGVTLIVGCGRKAEPPELPESFPPPTPPELQEGQDAYTTACEICHGTSGLGTQLGPPLVHEVYRTSHHADQAFHVAVRRGVRAHHFTYGDMPAQPNVTTEQVDAIVDYVRWLQRSAGIQ